MLFRAGVVVTVVIATGLSLAAVAAFLLRRLRF
ncbi:Hypothetical protein AAM4_0589 [Actinomyces succiniciruminis]|nr:Hypothetical protein AAM4_0589 [Actinomyces succiniciruminis]